jgi:5-methyltetrahydropteroyltriglutamate--homocysteine methyltransferase
MTLPFRAEHVGSLLRPRALRDAFRARQAGRTDAAAFEETMAHCIRDAVAMQESVGLRVVTDGEFRRGSWFFGFVQAVEGFAVRPAEFAFHDAAGGSLAFETGYAASRLRRTHGIVTDDYRFLKTATRRTAKVTIPAPSVSHFFRPGDPFDRAVYSEAEAYWDDLVAIYREEIAELGRLGCTYVQLDEVPLAMLSDGNVQDTLRGAGQDPAALLDTYIAKANAALAGRPAGMKAAMHLCCGNYKGMWMAEGGYDWVAERLFGEVDVDGFLLEYDTPRAGDFAALRFLPHGKTAVLGLVSSKTAALESKDSLKRRIDEAARHAPLGQLALSPQCGFASSAGGNPIGEDDQRRKLALVVEVANEVWGGA